MVHETQKVTTHVQKSTHTSMQIFTWIIVFIIYIYFLSFDPEMTHSISVNAMTYTMRSINNEL